MATWGYCNVANPGELPPIEDVISRVGEPLEVPFYLNNIFFETQPSFLAFDDVFVLGYLKLDLDLVFRKYEVAKSVPTCMHIFRIYAAYYKELYVFNGRILRHPLAPSTPKIRHLWV